jgi:hypothetical protein
MNRTTLKVSILVISLLVFQFGIPRPISPLQVDAGIEPIVQAIQAPVNSVTSFELNDTDSDEVLEISILDPGIYLLNLSLFVDEAAPNLDLDAEYYQSMDWWWPQIGSYLESLQSFDTSSWNNVPENNTVFDERDVVCVRPGYFRIDIRIDIPTPGDLVSGNLTVTQLLPFAAIPNALPMGQNSTLEWTEDQTWQGLRINLPVDEFYNFTAFAGLNWETTAGWLGDGFFQPVGLYLMDLEYGQYLPYNMWSPGFNIPAGASTNNSIVGPFISQEVLRGGDYYLLGKSDDFTFLNNSVANFTLNVSPVQSQIIVPNIGLELQFNMTPNVYEQYVAVTIPEGHYFNASFSNPQGFNWTVTTYDAWAGGYTGPFLRTYEDLSTAWIDQENLERGWTTAQGGGQPMLGVLGSMYFEQWMTDATLTTYDNGSIISAIPPFGLGPSSWFNTFFFHVVATPYGAGPYSPNFTVTAHFDILPFPELTPLGLTFDFNSTFGPYYHFFALPQASGAIYETTAMASEYTSSGTIRIEDTPQPMTYADWQWMGLFIQLAFADPATGMGISQNTNDTATLTYVSVRDTINYLWVQGPGMIGGDMTEGNVSLTITPPMAYIPGTVASVASESPEDFAAYTFNVVAGNTYVLNMHLRPDGVNAYGAFFNTLGHFPFIISSMLQLYIAASIGMPFSMTYTGTFTAKTTGRVTFIIQAEGTVEFSITEVITLGSMTGIAILVGIAIVMLVIGILVGYLVFRRNVLSRLRRT